MITPHFSLCHEVGCCIRMRSVLRGCVFTEELKPQRNADEHGFRSVFIRVPLWLRSYCGIAKASAPRVWLSFASLTLYSAKKGPWGISKRCEKLKGMRTPSTSLNLLFAVPKV